MEKLLSLRNFQGACKMLERVDQLRLSGNRYCSQGETAEKILKPSAVGKKRSRMPNKSQSCKSNAKRKTYKKNKKDILQRREKLEEDSESMLPSEISGRELKTLKAMLRLILNQERKIIAPLHLIFDDGGVTWDYIVRLYKIWKKTNMDEKLFPAFVWHAYDVKLGNKNSWDPKHITVVFNNVKPSGEKYVRPDFWQKLKKKLKGRIDWRFAFDGFPQSKIFRGHNTYLYPWGSKVYFNPPFHSYLKFFKHLLPQFQSGRVTDVLMVMWYEKWHGGHGIRTQSTTSRDTREKIPGWIIDLKEKHNTTVVDFWYDFSKPDGSLHGSKRRVVCVHLFH